MTAASKPTRAWQAALCAASLAIALPRTALAEATADAGMPRELAREVAARAAERGIAAEDVLAPVADAARRGVPADLVAAKVLEGLAKGIPAPRIAEVARGLADRLVAAEGLLGRARDAGLAPPAHRRAALADLAGALAHGVRAADVEELVDAAHAAKGGQSDAVVSAAHALGELSRRGVPPSASLVLGRALAKGPAHPPGEIPALFDAYVAEGGRDAGPFLDEAARRVAAGRKLDGVVDRFGESSDRVIRDRGAARADKDAGVAGSDVGRKGGASGLAPAERSDAARGAVPGLDDAVRGRSQAKSDPARSRR